MRRRRGFLEWVGAMALVGLGLGVCLAQGPPPPPLPPSLPSVPSPPASQPGPPRGFPVTSTHGSPGARIPPAASPVSAEDAQIIAVVGDVPILAGEILPQVRELLGSPPPGTPPSVLQKRKRQLLKQLLEKRIDVEILYQAFWEAVPESKRKEAAADIRRQLDRQFYSAYLPRLLKMAKLDSVEQLDQALRKLGSSLELRKEDFHRQALAQMVISRNVPRESEVTHEELLEYYQEHRQEFAHPARVRWEKLTVLFERYPTKAAAELAIVEMGNRVLRGAPFAEVAKRYSQGPRAAYGGRYDWTSQGALVSDVLDRALFSLPVGRLSEILEDRQGFHIVRVLERQPAGYTPFEQVQDELKRRIQQQRYKRRLAEYLASLRKRTYVWTIFDGTAPRTKPSPSRQAP